MANLPTRESEIGQLLMLATSDFHARIERDLAARQITGLSKRHRGVFLHLAKVGRCRSVDLAQAVGIRPQSMMVIIHELEALGLIERCADPTDSRAKLIGFTSRGKDLIKELATSTETVWHQYEELLGTGNILRLYQDLKTLVAQSDEAVSKA